MNEMRYANAFCEVLEILKYIPKDDYEKIPLEIIELFEDNSNTDYVVSYDPNIDLSNQKISKEARIIIAILFRDYWATQIQKDKINAKESYDTIRLEEVKKETYNPDNFFKTDKTAEKAQENNFNETVLIAYKENFFVKFKNFIFRLLHIK